MLSRSSFWMLVVGAIGLGYGQATLAVHLTSNTGTTSCLICGSDGAFLTQFPEPADLQITCRDATNDTECPDPNFVEAPKSFSAEFQVGNGDLAGEGNIVFGGIVTSQPASETDLSVFVPGKVGFFRVDIQVLGATGTCEPATLDDPAHCAYSMTYGDIDGNQPGVTIVGRLTLDETLNEFIPGGPDGLGSAEGLRELAGCAPAPAPCEVVTDVFVEDGLKGNQISTFFPAEGLFQVGDLLNFAVTAVASNTPQTKVKYSQFDLRKCHNRLHEASNPLPKECEKIKGKPARSVTETDAGLLVGVDYRPNTNDEVTSTGNNVVPIVVICANPKTGEALLDAPRVDLSTIRVNETVVPFGFRFRDFDGDGCLDIDMKASEAAIADTLDGTFPVVVVTGEVSNTELPDCSDEFETPDCTSFQGTDDVILKN